MIKLYFFLLIFIFSCSSYEIKLQKEVSKRVFPIEKQSTVYSLYIFREFTVNGEVPAAEVVINGNLVCPLRQSHSCVFQTKDTSPIALSVIQNKKPKSFKITPKLGNVEYVKFIMRRESNSSFWFGSPSFFFVPSTLEEASSTTNDNFFEVIPQKFIPGKK